MPTDFKLDPITHDLDLSSQGIELFDNNTDVVAQRVKIALLTHHGEWFRDVDLGVPYRAFSAIKNSKELIDEYLREYVRGVEDVEELIDYSSVLDGDTRVLTVNLSIRTSSGQIVNLFLEV